MRFLASAAPAISLLAALCAPMATAQTLVADRDTDRIAACLANTPSATCAGAAFNSCMRELDADETGASHFQRDCFEREAAAWRALIDNHAAEYRAAAPESATPLDAYLASAAANDESRCRVEDAEFAELSGLGYGECLMDALPARDAWLRGLIAHRGAFNTE